MSDHSEILLFQVGARVFAAEVYDVVRVGNVRDEPEGALLLESALGRPFSRHRGIVVSGHEVGAERTLVVDQVLGVRSIPDSDLHALPAFAAECLQSPAVTGFVLVDESPTLLVDLPTLVREQRTGAAAAAAP
ncbi:MAG TPA: chemotaxis protein CheW [Anaeromyxobacteraceae bacterium]|nr:chemotaxis protein CheW [Anaeromyxobacteraceae bacterium]